MSRQRIRVPLVLGITSLMHATVVAASLTVPILAPLLIQETDVPASYVGYYASIVYGTAMLSAVSTVGAVRRFGAMRMMQLSLLAVAGGLFCVPAGTVLVLALSGLFIGIAYGPVNPTGSHLLTRHTPAAARSLIFSIKQMSVPLGGAAAGFALPRLAAAYGLRPTVIGFGLAAIILAVSISPWRGGLDGDRDPAAPIRNPDLYSPLRLVFAEAQFRDLAIAAGVLSGVQFCIGAYFVTALVGSAGRTLAESGSMLSAMLMASIGGRILWGWLADRLTPRRVLALLAFLIACTTGSLALLSTSWSYGAILALSLAIGITAFSWSGILMAEVARLAIGVGVVDATAGVMFFAYLGALGIPTLVAGMAAFADSLKVGFLLFSVVAFPLGLRFLKRPPAPARLTE